MGQSGQWGGRQNAYYESLSQPRDRAQLVAEGGQTGWADRLGKVLALCPKKCDTRDDGKSDEVGGAQDALRGHRPVFRSLSGAESSTSQSPVKLT